MLQRFLRHIERNSILLFLIPADSESHFEEFKILENELPREFVYPVDHYPEKIISHNLDKTPIIRGKLQGIKGQYLLMDTGVINIRKYTGYELKVRAE